MKVIYEVLVSEVKRKGVHTHIVDSTEILMAWTPEGVKVYSGVCPHLGGPLLKGTCSGNQVRCPWHHYEFDLTTGKCLTPPGIPWKQCHNVSPQKPFKLKLKPLPFQVENDWVQVLI